MRYPTKTYALRMDAHWMPVGHMDVPDDQIAKVRKERKDENGDGAFNF